MPASKMRVPSCAPASASGGIASVSDAMPPALPTTARRAVVQMMANDYEERPMEDINRSGPTEDRREELRLLMKKLKESGKLGATGMMST